MEITSTQGLTPIGTDIKDLTYVDPRPSLTEQCYAVCALDAAGNESEPSQSQYLNFSLLPVPNLTVTAEEGKLPVISWTSPGGNIVSFNAYLKGQQGENIHMNSSPLTATSITDEGYNGTDREYTVTSVDKNGFESVGHKARLQVLSIQLTPDAALYRGVVNRLHFLVTNNSLDAASINRLDVSFAGKTYSSSAFSLGAGEVKDVSVVVGGDKNLPDVQALTLALVRTPESNTTIQSIAHAEIPVGNASFSLSIQNEVLTKGAMGQVSFTLYNTTSEEIDILTARAGEQPSTDIRFKILDTDGNVLSSVPLMENAGTNIVTVSNGNFVARIPSGQSFTCKAAEIYLPLAAPDGVTLQVEIDRVYYHYGRSDQVVVPGLVASSTIALVDTSYYARVLAVNPMTSVGNNPVTISGFAFD